MNTSALCFDARLLRHQPLAAHDADHPECPQRLLAIYAHLQRTGLLARFERVPIDEATLAALHRNHTHNHVAAMSATADLAPEQLVEYASQFNSVYLNQQTSECARLAAGGVVRLVRAVHGREFRNALALVRPPGHHAEPAEACGFCIYNNVAVAVKSLQADADGRGERRPRVLIVDWDVHHGNGTQSSFYNDPNVLFVSIHRHDDGRFYPATPEGGADRVGDGVGRGYNINVPWPSGGFGDADYVHVFQQLVMPIAHAYQPELVVVSCGFDAAINDPIGECRLTPQVYGHLTHMLMALAGGRVVLALEGGYRLDTIAECAYECARVLVGESPAPLYDLTANRWASLLSRKRRRADSLNSGESREENAENDDEDDDDLPPADDPKDRRPRLECVELVDQLRGMLSEYWPVLGRLDVRAAESPVNARDLALVYRSVQLQKLKLHAVDTGDGFSDFAWLHTSANSESSAKRVILIHDLPFIRSRTDATENLLLLEQSGYHDHSFELLRHFVKLGYACVDVCVDSPAPRTRHHAYSNAKSTRQKTVIKRQQGMALLKYLFSEYVAGGGDTLLVMYGWMTALYSEFVADCAVETSSIIGSFVIPGRESLLTSPPVLPLYPEPPKAKRKWYRKRSVFFMAAASSIDQQLTESAPPSNNTSFLRTQTSSSSVPEADADQEDIIKVDGLHVVPLLANGLEHVLTDKYDVLVRLMEELFNNE